MHNRREVLTNLVTLTVTSNVSSVIEFNVGGVRESFTGTSASIKVDQGKTVEWRVSADGYISKNGIEVMRNDKDVSVSLDPETVTFTINTNVSASITINGDTSTGVTSKSASVVRGGSVNWSVSSAGYFSQSGSESSLTEDKSVRVSLVSGVTSTCTARYIWCTDGSFVAPECYQDSGKTAYGYALSSSQVARLTRSGNMVWAPGNSPFYKNSNGAYSETDGVPNSNTLKSISGFNSTNCPAVYYACTQTNAGKTSYMPAKYELYELYDSIMTGSVMHGQMKDDLLTAGLYESCNYRFNTGYDNGTTSGEWSVIWSSTEYQESNYVAFPLNYGRGQQLTGKDCTDYVCVIPFFRF